MLTVQLDQAGTAQFQQLTETLGEAQATAHLGLLALRKHCQGDFAYFCRMILGYTDMNAEHEALCEFLQHDPATLKLILMPRYTFKSSILTIGKTLWDLLRDPNERILIASDAAEKAEGFLLGIKNHILGLTHGQGFRTLTWGQTWEVDPQQQTWNQSAIVIKARTRAAVEPSVDTAGLETSKVGKHYSRIRFDDLVTDKNVTTKDLMDKVEECFKKSGSLLDPSGSTDLGGTRWHFGDLYGRLLAEYRGRPGFAVFHRKAYEGERYFFADIGKNSLTPARLAEKLATQKTRLFSALYQNEPTSAEDQTFKAEHFRFYTAAKDAAFWAWAQQLYITCVLDAIPPPTSDHGDDAALTVVGTDADQVMYALDAVAGRLTVEQQIEHGLALHARWRFRKFGLETNAFQRMIRSALDLKLAERRRSPAWRPFSIVEFSGITQGNKEQRIQGLQPWHRQGLLRLPGERLELLSGVWSRLAYQMMEFPHSQHDDLLDSLAYHLQLKQPGTATNRPEEYPYGSAKWFERHYWLPREQARQRSLPRRQRGAVPQLAFS